MIGIEIVWSDGRKEWIDPVEKYDIKSNEIEWVISNGLYYYTYPKDSVTLMEYGLHPCCGSDVRGWHTYKCERSGE